jgi:hypothetical protein
MRRPGTRLDNPLAATAAPPLGRDGRERSADEPVIIVDEPAGTPPRRVRQWISDHGTAIVAAAAVAATIGAALADGRPTGLAAADVVLRAVFACGLTLATAAARRWTWIVLATVAAGLALYQPIAIVGWASLVVALGCALVEVRRREAGAVIGALAALTLTRLPPVEPAWLSPTLVALAVTGTLCSAYRAQDRIARLRLRRGIYGLAFAVTACAGGLALAAARGAPAADEGLDRANAGIAAAKDGDIDVATAHLDASVEAFAHADGAFNAWYARPARLVPVLSQQADALGRMATVAHELADVARDTIEQVDYRSVAVVDGRIDLDRIATLEAPLTDVTTALGRAQIAGGEISTDWVVPPVRRRYTQLRERVAQTHTEADVALDAVRVAPAMLGRDGPRHYFVAFTTPAESRGLGGFMGNFAVLSADDGRLELTRSDRSDAIEARRGDPPRRLDAPPDYVARHGWLNPQNVVRDITISPDFPSVAEALAGTYPQVPGGHRVDGVIVVDPYALAAMLKITGPVTVDGLDEPLTAANAADVLLRRQYLRFEEAYDERVDFLDGAARRTFDALLELRTVEPARWASILGPLVEQRRLLVTSTHADEAVLLSRLGLDAPFPRPDDADFFALSVLNAGNNKIDIFLHRSIDYRAEWDPVTGQVRARATIELRNDAPADGMPAYVIGNRPSARQPDGTNWLWLDLYSPHALVAATVDGRKLPMAPGEELGHNVYRGYVAVPSKSTATIEVELAGLRAPGDRYEIRWFQQPSVHPDDVSVTLAPSAPWRARVEGGDGQDATAGPEASARVPESRVDGEVSFSVTSTEP